MQDLTNNSMTFMDLLEAEHDDIVIGEEAWDVDYCCDLALVQGGSSPTMELIATRRPFPSFPLQRHIAEVLDTRVGALMRRRACC